jgi:hypothetical protein
MPSMSKCQEREPQAGQTPFINGLTKKSRWLCHGLTRRCLVSGRVSPITRWLPHVPRLNQSRPISTVKTQSRVKLWSNSLMETTKRCATRVRSTPVRFQSRFLRTGHVRSIATGRTPASGPHFASLCSPAKLTPAYDTNDCWWSLNTKYNHQLLHKLTWNESQSIVVGFDSNKFHGFWSPCLAGYLIFHQEKLSQMMNWSTPLQRARRYDRNRYIICYIWSSK